MNSSVCIYSLSDCSEPTDFGRELFCVSVCVCVSSAAFSERLALGRGRWGERGGEQGPYVES